VPKPLVKEVVSLGLNPSVNGSLWDMLAFKWVDPLMKRGNGKALEMSDLWELRDEDSMAALSTRFQVTREGLRGRGDRGETGARLDMEERDGPLCILPCMY
jgi:hypothetical protein